MSHEEAGKKVATLQRITTIKNSIKKLAKKVAVSLKALQVRTVTQIIIQTVTIITIVITVQ